jgi:5-methyltetrahydrofolate--homocysteine methyltransferase
MDADARLRLLAEAVMKMDVQNVPALTQAALDEGLSPNEILGRGLSEGMRAVGEKFRDGDCFMPEVLASCDTYYAALDVVQPLIEAAQVAQTVGKIVIGSIHGDVHTVGKDVAIPVFRAEGFEIVDLGIDVADQAFVEAIRDHQPDIVGLGTYMTSTFLHTGETVKAIENAGLRDRVKIICGGPCVHARAAQDMGADDASSTAWDGVDIMKAWVSE